MADFSIAGFAAHLVKLSIGGEVLTDSMLEYVGNRIERCAKAKIGQLQDQAGPFEAWANLAESTIQSKERAGIDINDDGSPLFRTGNLQDSIEHQVGFQEVQIGTNDPIAEYQEFGTERIPPRSFLGSTAFEEAPGLVDRLGVGLVAHLEGNGDVKTRFKIE